MIVALEGHSFSGKTTLFNYLTNTLDVIAIAEHDIYAKGTDNYPPFPAQNEEMAKTSVDFFARLEIERARDAATADSIPVLYDRSFLSVVLFQKYMKHLDIPGEFHAYEYAKKKFLELAQDGQIALPDHLVFVKCASVELYMERQSRFVSVEYLRGVKALSFFEGEYKRILRVYQAYNRSTVITTNNSKHCLAENALQIMPALQQQALNGDESSSIIDKLKDIL